MSRGNYVENWKIFVEINFEKVNINMFERDLENVHGILR